MSKFDYYKCDECGKILNNAECDENQLMFTLIANYDCSPDLSFNVGGKCAHFCGVDCLRRFTKKIEEHCDLPTIEYNSNCENLKAKLKTSEEKQK